MIAIYEDIGGEMRAADFEATAVYDEGTWIADAGGWEEYYPEGTPEEVIIDQVDSPSAVVVEVDRDPEELIEKVREREEADGER